MGDFVLRLFKDFTRFVCLCYFLLVEEMSAIGCGTNDLMTCVTTIASFFKLLQGLCFR